MTIEDALGLMTGTVRQEYSEAIVDRWNSIMRERKASEAVAKQLSPACNRMRDYVKQGLGLVTAKARRGVSIEWSGRSFYIDHSKGPELIGPYLHFELRNGTGISVHVEGIVTSKEHLDGIIRDVKRHVDAMKEYSSAVA